jgi:O-antigen/teichoic acid export membrane protein
LDSSPKFLGFSTSAWRRASGEAFWTLGAQAAAALAGLLGIRLLTELAPKEVFGTATLLTGSIVLARNCFIAPFTSAGIYFHPQYVAAKRTRWFMHQITRLVWLGTVPCAVLLLGGFVGWQAWKGESLSLGLAFASLPLLLIDSAKVVRLNRLGAERLRRAGALWASADAWLPVLASAALLKWWSVSSEAYLLGQGLGLLPGLWFFGWAYHPPIAEDAPTPPLETREELVRKVMTYGLPFIPLSILSWVSNLGDRYVLGTLLGAGAVGTYVAAYSLASRPIVVMSGAIGMLARPILFEAQGRGEHDKARRVYLMWLGVVLVFGAVATLALWVAAPYIADLLLAKAYRSAAPQIFPWVAAGYSFAMIAQVVENRLLSKGQSRSLLAPSIAGAVANVLLNFVLIPRFGIAGAAQATTGSFVVQLVAISIALARFKSAPQAAVP